MGSFSRCNTLHLLNNTVELFQDSAASSWQGRVVLRRHCPQDLYHCMGIEIECKSDDFRSLPIWPLRAAGQVIPWGERRLPTSGGDRAGPKRAPPAVIEAGSGCEQDLGSPATWPLV